LPAPSSSRAGFGLTGREALARKATQSNTLFVDELAGIAETIGLSGNAIARFAAETFGTRCSTWRPSTSISCRRTTIDKKLVTSLRVLALRKRGNRLAVGVSDPTNYQALDQIKFQTQLALDIIVVEHEQLVRLIEATTQSASQSLERLIDDDVSFEDLLQKARKRRRSPARPTSTTRRWCASCRSCCSMQSVTGPPTCISSPMRSF